ncbi:MAG: site-specific DNA-methyltransferase [Lachnospiraceae bacterium]|nr:site-specific DNA-methyltransferase [Lachnospiraceae bacterium]
MFYPKALANFKRYTAKGVGKVKAISMEDSLVIKGNNLLTLSSLGKRYANKVKMVYWDVPYNTGSDSFGYNDKFSRSSWLVFIKNRVEKVLPMLSDRGGVFLIQCSFHQYSYLKVLLDEIIGNYVMTFNVLVRHPDRTLTTDKEFNDVIEYVLVYSKRPDFRMPRMVEEKTVNDYRWAVKELSKGKAVTFDGRKGRVFLPGEYELYKAEPAKENFKVMTVRGSIKEKVSSGRFYVKYLQPLEGQYPPKTLFKVDGIGDDMYDYRYFYLPPKGNKNGAYLQGMPMSSNVTYKPYPNFLDFVQSYNVVNEEGGVEFRNGKKPEDLLEFLMGIFTAEGDLVLDAFGGSGTTAAVAMKMNRRFILCEQMDYVETVTVKRIQGELQGSFVYFELAKLNQRFVERIQKAKEKDLKAIWKDMMATGLISYKVRPKDVDLSSEDFNALTKEEKKRLLLSLLDMNQLYVNLCDVDDAESGLTDEEKALTKAFYGVE